MYKHDGSDYLDIDAILCDDELIPSQTIFECDKLNWLDPSSIDKESNLPSQSHIQLPLWLARVLHDNEMILVEPCTVHTKTMRSHLLADPAVVSMQSCPYFYSMGLLSADRIDDVERREILPLMVYAYRMRFVEILDKALNWGGSDYSAFMRTLTQEEESTKDFEKWKKETILKPEASSVLKRNIKRKRERED